VRQEEVHDEGCVETPIPWVIVDEYSVYLERFRRVCGVDRLRKRECELFVERQELRGEWPYFGVSYEYICWENDGLEAIALYVVSHCSP
jgi:hypothetical protein